MGEKMRKTEILRKREVISNTNSWNDYLFDKILNFY